MGEYTMRVLCLLILITVVSAYRNPDFHRNGEVKQIYNQPFCSYHHHKHHYEEALLPHNHYQRRKQVFTGGRGLEKDEQEEGYSLNEIKQRRKRNLRTLLNNDVKPTPQKRIVRSIDEEVVEPDNCKMMVACQLHARAKLSPFHTFQLYFLRNEGLAQYWDNRKFDDCATVYPCGSNRQSIKAVTDSKDTPLSSINKVTDQRRQFDSAGTVVLKV